MTEITNGKIIARLIETEKRICDILDECISQEIMDMYMAKRDLLYNILAVDCGIDCDVIDAIIEGVDSLYDN